VANFLARRAPRTGTSEFGKSFEHYILMELRAWRAYRHADVPISFWRTASGFEVDFVLGDFAMAIEVKAGQRVHDGDLAPLRALRQEHTVKNAVVVCMETTPRTTADGIRIVPWRTFLDEIWQGDLVG
jgi:predicted AAA+ superfamily ATPase